MLAMNKIQPPAKTSKDFFAKFLRVRAENRSIWHSANDFGFFKPVVMDHPLIRHSLVRIMILLSLLLNRRDRREMICWTCGIKGHSRAQCNKSAHPDRNQENVPFAQSTMGKRLALKFPSRPVCDSTRRLDGPLIAPNPTAGTGKRISF
jgi:hypothetical protein